MTRRRWFLAAAVVAAAALVAAILARREPRDPLVRLARAACTLETRITEARLSGFPYRPRPVASRPAKLDAGRLRLRSVAGKILQSVPHNDHLAGVAALIAGAADDAVKRLTVCTETHPNDAALWSDLAAARYTAANTNDDPQQLVSALAAADHALRIAPLPEAMFNRGLTLESLGLYAAAAKQYDAHARSDDSSDWAKEARERAARLRVPTAAEEWEKALPLLKEAASTGDQKTVQAIVRKFTQESESWSETVFLGEWATAILRGDVATSEDRLRIADSVGRAIADFSGDRLLRDAVAAIKRDNDRERLATLASGYVEYDTARKLYKLRRVTNAQTLFVASTSKFAKVGSPMHFVARYYTTSCLHNLNNDDKALKDLVALRDEVPRAYSDLRGRLLWNIGLIRAREGMQYAALSAETDAAAIFEKCGEQPNAITMLGQAAGSAALLGRQAEAWQTRRTLFRAISLRGDLGELQVALDIAARTETVEQAWENAYSLLTLATDDALRVNPQIAVNTLLWRALAAQRLGLDRHYLQQHVAEAQQAAARISDEPLRRRAAADVTFAQAVIVCKTDPARAATLLDQYVDVVHAAGSAYLLPEALLERAIALRALGDRDRARASLAEATSILRTRQAGRPHDEFREAFFSTATAVARELCSTLLDEGNAVGALGAVDANRSEAYGVASFDLHSIPKGTLLLEYVVLNDRIAVFTGQSDQVHAHWLTNSSAALRLCSTSEGAPLCGGLLLGPVMGLVRDATDVVIVPDPAFRSVRFAALRLPGTTRYLVEDVTVTIAPSAAVAFGRQQSVTASDVDSLVIVGNPRPDELRFGGLPPLPASRQEAMTLASRHRDALLFTDQNATPEHVLSALRSASILYVAAHAFTSRDPRQSHIVLTPGGEDEGVLYLKDIERSRADVLQLVVLTGCKTAIGPDRSVAVGSLALAFVAIGATHVVGTNADVEDSIAANFSSWFDEELRTARSPARALRAVQLRMLRSHDARFRRPTTWGAFEIYGVAPYAETN
jgi:tetratricopeptide (TPR) repeat protein